MATKDYSGALGTWSFTPEGDTTLTAMSGNIVKGGKFEFDSVSIASPAHMPLTDMPTFGADGRSRHPAPERS